MKLLYLLYLFCSAALTAQAQWTTSFAKETNDVYATLRLRADVFLNVNPPKLARETVTHTIEQLDPRQINQQWFGGTTLLHAASYYGNPEVCRLLLEKGANPQIRDNDGLTALHWAVIWNICEFGYLSDESPRQREFQKNKTAVVKLLLSAKSGIDARDNRGDTPLHWAVVPQPNGDSDSAMLLENVRCLLAEKPSINLTNNQGRTPLGVVFDRDYGFRNTNMVQLLKENGAR